MSDFARDIEPCERVRKDGGLDREGLGNRAGSERVDDVCGYVELAKGLLTPVAPRL